MMKQNNKTISILKRQKYTLAALLLAFTTAMPLLHTEKAKAYNLLVPRRIKMSNSSPGDEATGKGDNVAYDVAFTLSSAHDIGSIKIDFCQNSPIIGETCLAPSGWGFNTHKDTVSLNNVSATLDGTIAKDTLLSTSNSMVITRTGGSGSIAAGSVISFTFGDGSTDGFRNPVDACPDTGGDAIPACASQTGNQLGSFYARIRTYTSTNASGTEVDAGGIALSTAASLTITSKVTERLVFCVYTGALCNTGTANYGIALGDANGVLSPSGTYVNKATKYDILTNASQGVRVRVKGDTLKTGAFSISPIGPTPTQVSGPSHVGTEQFGFCTYRSSGDVSLSPHAPYGGDSGGTGASAACSGTVQTSGTTSPGGDNNAYFAFDTTTTSGSPDVRDDENITGTYGDTFADKAAGDTSTGTLVFAANISNTTEAGIYTTTLYFIATGSF